MSMSAPETEQEVLAGLVERVTFHSQENGFCVLRLKARGHRDLVTVIPDDPVGVQSIAILQRRCSHVRSPKTPQYIPHSA